MGTGATIPGSLRFESIPALLRTVRPSDPLVLYDCDGNAAASQTLGRMLRFTDVREYPAGFLDWAGAGQPVARDAPVS